jgi:hypothetical protein
VTTRFSRSETVLPSLVSRPTNVLQPEEFLLRSHFTLGEEGWERVADYALTWNIENAAARQQPATT